jgi:SAM-dependent methyltransferase
VTPLDRLIQRIRVNKAKPHIPRGARLLDIGCADGYLLRELGPHVHDSVGIDPDGTPTEGSGPGPSRTSNFRIVRGGFPDDLHVEGPFDAITMLSVFEHFADADRPRVVEACRRLLRPGGRVIITVPAPVVDRIVDVLRTLRLAHGMDIESHHRYEPGETPRHFGGFRVARHERFELGLNHLFVLER